MYGTQTHSGQCLFLSSTRTKLNTFESIVFDCSYFKNQVESGLVRTIHCLLPKKNKVHFCLPSEARAASQQQLHEDRPEQEDTYLKRCKEVYLHWTQKKGTGP